MEVEWGEGTRVREGGREGGGAPEYSKLHNVGGGEQFTVKISLFVYAQGCQRYKNEIFIWNLKFEIFIH